MDLNTYFQLSVSVFCTLSVIILIVLLIWATMLRIKIGKLIVRLEEIIAEVRTTTDEVKSFVERTIASLEKFKESIITFEFIKKAAEEIISLVINKKKGKDGQAN